MNSGEHEIQVQSRIISSNQGWIIYFSLVPFINCSLIKFLTHVYPVVRIQSTAHLLLSPNMQAFMFKMTEKHDLMWKEYDFSYTGVFNSNAIIGEF